MAYKIQKINKKRERRNYGKTKNAIELSNLLEIQKDSYEWFITEGIKEVFDDIFPVESFTGNLSLEFEIIALMNQDIPLNNVKNAILLMQRH